MSSCAPATALDVAGVRAIRFAGDGAPGTVMVHFHGGGFRQGQPEMIAGYAADLAVAAHLEVMCPAYRLAPEHPFPASLNDGLRFVTGLAEKGYDRILLAGDSAGGGLAAGVALYCADRGIDVSGLVLHSPWLDLTLSSMFFEANESSDPLFSRLAAEEARELYLQGHSPKDPAASPLFGDSKAFPPTFISVGRGEVLFGDATSLQTRLQEAGRIASLCAVEGMDHVAVTRGRALPGAAKVFQETVTFLSRLP